eukprot:TRINITY_DN1638_c0_g1_i2.p1 TRINITY_DN1638_c0_g1~~TRINITY_DN1638_c0_g1_i2.p1  ORF type:complete len:386 (-),score=66.37 TRINITY_DN1638_c0_g1_i2:77-1234(-)
MRLTTKYATLCFLGLVFSVLALSLSGVAQCSEYDPHIFPTHGPWFEGWYTRIIDIQNHRSVAVINAQFISTKGVPSGYAMVAYATNDSALQVQEAFPVFETTDCSGASITKNPQLSSPPCFLTRSHNSQDCAVVMNTTAIGPSLAQSQTQFSVRINSRTTFTATMKDPVLWDKYGFGPEGIAVKVPLLGLYWYVYSLGSRVEYELRVDNMVWKGVGLAHQEKNWGDQFPSAWIWLQGVSQDQHVHFALAGGPKKLGPVEPKLWLIGYRSPSLTWNFNPQRVGAVYHDVEDPCSGNFTITAEWLNRKLVVRATAPPSSFQNCLYGPTSAGFRPLCLESFVASIDIEAYNTNLSGGEVLLEKYTLPSSALEFGGKFTCKPCSSVGKR